MVCLGSLRWRPARFLLSLDGRSEKAEMKLVCVFFAALTALLGSHDGCAQSTYPDRAIRILVGFPPGGPLTSQRGCLRISLPRPGANPFWSRMRPAPAAMLR